AAEIDQLLPVLNLFPLTEIIFHPRTADQLYKGKIQEPVFKRISEQCVHPLVFNGDIFSLADYEQNRAQFTGTKTYMLGRGVLMNIFLPAEIKGAVLLTEEKRMKRAEFHQDIFRSYMEKMDNPGNALNKLKQFWIYFSHNFTNQRKVLKQVKKCTSIESYLKTVQKIFSS
ncbi:MAG TPA: tRNA-dihydrouridine synthase, partial [Prolixibacteraceae bacterium]|nr:tRNA-dihydrouridine synthase [Prolixibacteraceae bacterium]